MNKVAHFLAHELRRGLPAFIFFFVAFHMLSLTKAIAVADFSLTVMSASVATVGALIVTKAILLADNSKLANTFSHSLIGDVLWKTAIFIALATVFRIAEELIDGWVKHGGLRAGLAELSAAFSEPYFLMLEMWLAFLLFLYCLIAKLFTVIDPKKMTGLKVLEK